MRRLLLDTHVLLWWLARSTRLGPQARAAIADARNVVSVSAASAWEIAVKRALGKLEAPGDIEAWISGNGFEPLALSVGHAVFAAGLPRRHADPFDRLLIAQAIIDGLTLVTADDAIPLYRDDGLSLLAADA